MHLAQHLEATSLFIKTIKVLASVSIEKNAMFVRGESVKRCRLEMKEAIKETNTERDTDD